MEIPVFSYFVLEETAVRLFDVFGQVAEKNELRSGTFQLCDIFYLDISPA